MAESVEQPEGALPQPTEEVHLPDPTYIPVAVALAATIAIVGVVLSWWIFAFGTLVALILIVRWIRDTREDMSHLPLEH